MGMMLRFLVLALLSWEACAGFLHSFAPPPILHPLQTRIEAHFGDLGSYDVSKVAPGQHAMICCVPYANGASAKSSLKKHYFGDRVHTIHADAPTDNTCFLIESDDVVLTAAPDLKREKLKLLKLLDNIEVKRWEPMHPVLKVNPTLFKHIENAELFSAVSVAHENHKNKKRKMQSDPTDQYYYEGADATDKHEYELSIDINLRHRNEADKVVGEILQHLNDLQSHIGVTRKMLDAHPKGENVWSHGQGCEDELAGRKLSFRDASDAIDYTKIAHVSEDGIIFRSQDLHNSGISHSCFVHMVAKIVHHPSVTSVSKAGKFRILNDYAKSIIESNTYNTPGTSQSSRNSMWPYTQMGLNGTGQNIIISDTGLDQYSCSFREGDGSITPVSMSSTYTTDMTRRKVLNYVTWTYGDSTDYADGHGTHMAGSALGENVGNAAGVASTTDGIASSARLCFFDLAVGQSLYIPNPISDILRIGTVADAKIHSASWGSTNNYYSSKSIGMDTYSYTTDTKFLNIVACGNDGAEGYGTVGDPGISKNALTVGAHESHFTGSRPANQEYVAYFSSLGPTFDWRIKPDIVAPGCFVEAAEAAGSATNTCATSSKAGTSSATALTSGVAALVRQYFMDGRFTGTPFTPSGALLKAVLIHSGQQERKFAAAGGLLVPKMESGKEINIHDERIYSKMVDNGDDSPKVGDGSVPDFIQGFGRIYLQNVLPLSGVTTFDAKFYDDYTISSSNEFTWHVTTPSSISSSPVLRATLVWMDPPNVVVGSKFLLHDLDLSVHEVDSVSDPRGYRPSAANPIWYGNGGASPDSRNNVEQVTLKGMKASHIYRITVRAGVLTEAANQKFSLVLTYPTGSTITEPASASAQTAVVSGVVKNETICENDEIQLKVQKSSHLATGWDSTGKYSITSTGVNIERHLNASDFTSSMRQYDEICLKEGIYTLKMESDINLGQMAVDINDCYLHLQGMYATEATLSIATVGGELTCNYCYASHANVSVMQWSTPYGGRVGYGWENRTAYQIQDSSGTAVFTNTMNSGILERHDYCLPFDTYNLGFSAIPDDDDFESRGTYVSGWDDAFGIEDYSLDLYRCNSFVGDVDSFTCDGSGNCVKYSGSALWVSSTAITNSNCPTASATVAPPNTPGLYPTPVPTAAPTSGTGPTTDVTDSAGSDGLGLDVIYIVCGLVVAAIIAFYAHKHFGKAVSTVMNQSQAVNVEESAIELPEIRYPNASAPTMALDMAKETPQPRYEEVQKQDDLHTRSI